MDRTTFDATLALLLDERPFRPFTVTLKDGRRLQIDHHRAAGLRNGFAFFIGPGNIPSIFDYDSTVQIIGDLEAGTGDLPAAGASADPAA